jgi:hypothetical protein
VEGLGQIGVGVEGFDKFGRQVEIGRVFQRQDACPGIAHRFGKTGADQGLHGDGGGVVRKAQAVGVAGIGTLFLQHATGVFQQGCIEETEPEVTPESANDHDVAACMRIAGMAPFRGLGQPRVLQDTTERDQAAEPEAGRAVCGRKAGAAAAAFGEVVFDVADHRDFPFRSASNGRASRDFSAKNRGWSSVQSRMMFARNIILLWIPSDRVNIEEIRFPLFLITL